VSKAIRQDVQLTKPWYQSILNSLWISHERDPGAGMIPKHPPLPARERGGANHPCPSSSPVAAGMNNHSQNLPDSALPLSLLITGCSSGQVDAEAVAATRFRRLADRPALISQRHRRTSSVHSRRPLITSDKWEKSELTVLAIAQAQEAVKWVKPLRKEADAGHGASEHPP
jgi:hypothetical protein